MPSQGPEGRVNSAAAGFRAATRDAVRRHPGVVRIGARLGTAAVVGGAGWLSAGCAAAPSGPVIVNATNPRAYVNFLEHPGKDYGKTVTVKGSSGAPLEVGASPDKFFALNGARTIYTFSYTPKGGQEVSGIGPIGGLTAEGGNIGVPIYFSPGLGPVERRAADALEREQRSRGKLEVTGITGRVVALPAAVAERVHTGYGILVTDFTVQKTPRVSTVSAQSRRDPISSWNLPVYGKSNEASAVLQES